MALLSASLVVMVVGSTASARPRDSFPGDKLDLFSAPEGFDIGTAVAAAGKAK